MPRRAIARGADAGMVTAEIALALPALVLVLVFAVTVQSVVATRAACLDAARAAARAAARGDSDEVVGETARTVLRQVTDVSVVRRDGLVSVKVRARPATVGTRWAIPDVAADATAADEAGP